MARIKIDSHLYDRVKKIADAAGYPAPEDFIIHIIERELAILESAQSNEEVTERLRGLGYIE